MNTLRITIPENVHVSAVSKLIGFASEDILSFRTVDDTLELDLAQGSDPKTVEGKIGQLMKRFFKDAAGLTDEAVWEHHPEVVFTPHTKVMNSALVTDFGNGLISLKREAIALFDFFNRVFKNVGRDAGGIERKYPTLLPIDAFKKTGYLKTSPQYSLFCCPVREDIGDLQRIHVLAQDNRENEAISKPQHALSPAACFHAYMELEGGELDQPTVYTFSQNVFRNEGRFNWNDYGRLADYHVREIVFFGDREFVAEKREEICTRVKELIGRLNLDAMLCVTHDPFILPGMQLFKKIQHREQTKYEAQLAYSGDRYLAAASFNLHGDAFTSPFRIRVKNVPEPVTGCVGFGIERWVLAFLAQFGVDNRNWPTETAVITNGED